LGAPYLLCMLEARLLSLRRGYRGILLEMQNPPPQTDRICGTRKREACGYAQGPIVWPELRISSIGLAISFACTQRRTTASVLAPALARSCVAKCPHGAQGFAIFACAALCTCTRYSACSSQSAGWPRRPRLTFGHRRKGGLSEMFPWRSVAAKPEGISRECTYGRTPARLQRPLSFVRNQVRALSAAPALERASQHRGTVRRRHAPVHQGRPPIGHTGRQQGVAL
jgi:hypothetical protein